jgi:hypothetical protein
VPYDPDHVINKRSSATDPAGRATYYVCDSRQRLIKKTDALAWPALTGFKAVPRGTFVSGVLKVTV